MVFLEIANVPLRTVFTKTVTYIDTFNQLILIENKAWSTECVQKLG